MAFTAAKAAAFTWSGVVTIDSAKEQVLPGTDPSDQDQPSATVEAEDGDGSVWPAFAGLFRQHGARMKSVAANLLGSTADAEDAVQDTFIKVHRGASSFRGQAQATTWIF